MICIYHLDFSTLTAQLSSLALVHYTSPQLSSSESLATVLLSNNVVNFQPTSQEHLTWLTHYSFCENSPLGLPLSHYILLTSLNFSTTSLCLPPLCLPLHSAQHGLGSQAFLQYLLISFPNSIPSSLGIPVATRFMPPDRLLSVNSR